MITEFRKSISSTLYERAISPFFGTLVISWSLWNWKIFYLTFFISESVLNISKIEYITQNLNNINCLITYPLISTIVLLTIIPFITNGAYWLSLKFQQWRLDQKNVIERKQLLTIEQSIQLREEISIQEEKFEKFLKEKSDRIKQLELIIEEQNKKEKSIKANNLNQVKNIKIDSTKISDFFSKSKNVLEFSKVLYAIQNGYKIFAPSNHAEPDFVSLLESNDIIENKGNGHYSLTSLGKEYQKVYAEIKTK